MPALTPRSDSFRIPKRQRHVPEARAHVRRILKDWALDGELAHDVATVATELVTNAVRHCRVTLAEVEVVVSVRGDTRRGRSPSAYGRTSWSRGGPGERGGAESVPWAVAALGGPGGTVSSHVRPVVAVPAVRTLLGETAGESGARARRTHGWSICGRRRRGRPRAGVCHGVPE